MARGNDNSAVFLFRGFVATTVDAALLVEAAMAGALAPVAVKNGRINGAPVAVSGAVYVHKNVERWKEGLTLKWTTRRTGYTGFDFYREATGNQEEARTDAEIADENANRVGVLPYVGPYGANGANGKLIKRDGLIKKMISFKFGEDRWAIHAYYDMAAVAAGTLPRPRSSRYAGQLPRALRREFWEQQALNPERSGPRFVVMADDGNRGTARDWAVWSRAPRLLLSPAGPVPVPVPVAGAAAPAVPAGQPLAALPGVPAPPAAAVAPAARPKGKTPRRVSVSSAAAAGQPRPKRARHASPPPAAAAGPASLPPPAPAPIPAPLESPPPNSGGQEELPAADNLGMSDLMDLDALVDVPDMPQAPADNAVVAAARAGLNFVPWRVIFAGPSAWPSERVRAVPSGYGGFIFEMADAQNADAMPIDPALLALPQQPEADAPVLPADVRHAAAGPAAPAAPAPAPESAQQDDDNNGQ